MASKTWEIAAKLTARIDKALPGNLQKVAKEFNSLKNRSKQLNDMAKMMPKNLAKNMLEYQKINSKLQMLNKIKTTNGSLTKAQEKEYKKLTSTQEKLGKVIDKERKAYQRYSMELTKLKIPHGQLQNEIKKTAKEMERATAKQKLYNKASDFKKKVGNFGKKALVAGGKAVVGGAIAGTLAAGYFTMNSANQYANFEGQMKRVQAISGATKTQFNLLEKEALKLGATTSFTSIEAAQGMEKFALAGFKVNDIISAMPGMLNLAAASGENLALVSDIVSDNMTAFGMEAKDAGKVADIFAYTMSKTNTGVEQLGEAFKYVATQSEGLNISMEESSALLGLLADKGMKGSQAGTGLGAVYTSILQDAKKFEGLGTKLTDKKGNFVGTQNFLKQLDSFFKKQNITGFKRQQMISKMFDARAARVVNALLDGEKEINGQVYKGVERIAAQIDATKTESVGAAERMKEIMLEGANGARTLFFSAVDGLKMAIGKTVFTENTLDKIKLATKYVSEFNLVLLGTLSDDPINKFWQNVFSKVEKLKTIFKNVLEPGFQALKDILTVEFFVKLGKALLMVAYTAAWAFTKIAQGLKWVNETMGLDNVLVFIGTFATLSLVVTKTGKHFTKFMDTVKTIKTIGSLIGTIKTAMLGLGGPIVWIGALIVLVGFLIYKNWDKIKVWMMSFVISVTNKFLKFKDDVTAIYEEIKERIKTFFDSLKEYATSAIGNVKENVVAVWEVFKGWLDVAGNIFNLLFSIINPFKLIYDLGKAFYDNWDSSLSITENLKKGFYAFFEGLMEKIEKVKTSFLALGDKIKDIPIVGTLLKKLNIVEEPKADGSHRNGLDYVPHDGYIAELHKGERVLTAEENQSFGGRILNNLRSSKERENSNDSYTNNNKEIKVVIEGSKYEFNFPPSASMIPQEMLEKMYKDFQKMIEDNNKELERKVQEVVRTVI